MQIIKRTVMLLTLAVVATTVGCEEREQGVRAYDAAKDPPATTRPMFAADAMPGATGTMPPGAVTPPPAVPPEANEEVPDLHWTVPQGWKEIPGSGMRVATLIASENPKLELTVIPLEGGAGALLPNVNRWENQLGLPPSPQDKLKDVVKTSNVNGLEVNNVDLTGPEAQKPRVRMLAAIVPFGGKFWFFKMAGPVDQVSGQKDKFDTFIQSLKAGKGSPAAAAPNPGAGLGEMPAGHPPIGGGDAGQMPAGHPPVGGGQGAGEMPAGHPPIGGGAGQLPAGHPPTSAPATTAPAMQMKLAHWTAPGDWKEIPGSKLPRVVAFQVGAADQNSQMIATRFAAGNAGSFQDNLNRWRAQIGLPAVEDPHKTAMADVQLGKNDQGLLLEFDNPDNKKHMLVILGQPGGGDLYFFKLTGPTDLVTAQKQKFIDFAKSLEFAPEK